MTQPDSRVELSELCERAQTIATTFGPGSLEQNLTYACEEVVTSTWPGAALDEDMVRSTIEAIAMAEGWDPPAAYFGTESRRCVAYAERDSRSVMFRGQSVHLATVLHELAHLQAASAAHSQLFRHELCVLMRAHWGVEQASLLHSLYKGVGLDVVPWQATARRA
jgi:hypothetical protein